MATNSEQVLELYTAMFNRAADASGLNYWVNEMDSNGWSIQNVASSFAQQTEYQTAYPSSGSNSDFITTIYQNLLGRAPDTDGLNYWVGELDSGNVAPEHAVLAIISGAKANTTTQGISDAQLISNKTSVSDYFANTLSLNDLTEAASVMTNVSSDTSSVTQAQTTLNTIAANSYSADALGTFGDSKYLVYKTAKSYNDAVAAAAQVDSTNSSKLVQIDSTEENDFVYNLLTGNGITTIAQDGGSAAYAWIGASDSATEGTWLWSDGSAVAYTNWGSKDGFSEPDNFDGSHLGGSYTGQQDAGAMALTDWPVGTAGQWNDVDGVNTLAYVVEVA